MSFQALALEGVQAVLPASYQSPIVDIPTRKVLRPPQDPAVLCLQAKSSDYVRNAAGEGLIAGGFPLALSRAPWLRIRPSKPGHPPPQFCPDTTQTNNTTRPRSNLSASWR